MNPADCALARNVARQRATYNKTSTPMETTAASKAARITGWIMTILPSLLFLFSATMKIAHPPALDEGFAQMQIPVSWAMPLGSSSWPAS